MSKQELNAVFYLNGLEIKGIVHVQMILQKHDLVFRIVVAAYKTSFNIPA